jgi:hypothetical protein
MLPLTRSQTPQYPLHRLLLPDYTVSSRRLNYERRAVWRAAAVAAMAVGTYCHSEQCLDRLSLLILATKAY